MFLYMIYFISDLHFFHDREFIWKVRRFSSEEEMRETYLKEWEKTIDRDDDVYLLGDFCLGSDFDRIGELILSLKGKIHLIIGNHDSDARIEYYKTFDNIVEIVYATVLKYNGRRYYLSHYITETATLESDPKECVINLHGHLHTKQMFHEDKPYLINVSVDVTGGKFMTFDDIENAFNAKVKECIKYL